MGYANPVLEEFFRYQVPYAHEIEFDSDYWITLFKNEFADLLGQKIPLYLSDEIFSGMGPNYNLLFHPTDLGKMLNRLRHVFGKSIKPELERGLGLGFGKIRLFPALILDPVLSYSPNDFPHFFHRDSIMLR